jgi:hypothetical protein
VTSLSRELGAEQELDAFATTVASTFAGVYAREAREVEPAALAERVPATDALVADVAAALR